MDGLWKGLIKWPWMGIAAFCAAVFHIMYMAVYAAWWPLEWGWQQVYGKPKKNEPHGSAEFADRKTLKKAGYLKPGGFVVGKIDGKRVRANPQNSVIMFGKPGAGKSLTIAASIREAHGQDFIVYDPVRNEPGARSVYAETAEALEAKGYRVLVIDLDQPSRGIGFNPLDYVQMGTPTTFNRDCLALAQLNYPSVETSGASKHFSDLAQEIIKTAIAYHLSIGVRRLPEIVKRLFSSKESFDTFIDNVLASGDVAQQVLLSGLATTGKDEKGGSRTSASREMRMWVDPIIAHLTSINTGFNFDAAFDDKQPFALYIMGGASDPATTGAFARMVIGIAVATIQRRGTRLPKGLHIFIDEAANIGKCPALATAQRMFRKYGARVFFGYLNRNDMRAAMGKDDAKLLEDTCDFIIPGGMNDASLYNDMAELIGSRTALSQSISVNERGASESHSQFGRKLLTVAEWRARPAGTYIVMLDNLAAELRRPWDIKRDKVVY